MRKSIKRIVSSVLAATMVLTSCIVSNLSIATAAGEQTGLPITVDASEINFPLDQSYTGEVTVEVDFDVNGVLGGAGSLLRLRSSDGFDHEAALRVTSGTTGDTVIGKDNSGTPIGTTVIGNNKLVMTLNTVTGEITATYNGVTASRMDDSKYIGKDVSLIKFGTKTGRTTVVNSIKVTATGSVTEDTTEAPTEATTEAPTEAPTEATTEAPAGIPDGTYEQTGLPITVDASEINFPLDQSYTGEVTVEVDFDVNGVLGGAGSLLRLRSSDGFDHEAALRVTSGTTGDTVIGKDNSGTPIGTTVIGNNKLVMTLNTVTGEITATYNGVTASRMDDSKYIGKDVSLIKFGTKTGRTTVVNSIKVTVKGNNNPSVETTTEATTEAPATEATTEAITEAVTAAANEVLVTPSYKIDGENVVVDYNVSVGEGAMFNNYTMFLTFDPSVLTPVSAADGEIAITATDATGGSISIPASNATNIETQFTNAPEAGNTDFDGADGIKTQAELGKIKVAYCIFDKDFSQAEGSLPAFTESGKLFTVTYKINGDVNGSKLAAAIQTMNSVSADSNVQSTPNSVGSEVTISGYEAPTETTTIETPTPAGFQIKGDKPETVAGGNATVTFSLANTPDSGIANYTVIVKFDPAKLTITGGTTPGFDYDSNVVANQMAYVPVNDSDYGVDATNTKTAAELGIIKIAPLKNSGSVTGDAAVLTLDFTADASLTPGEYPVDITVIKTGDADGNIIECTGVAGAVVIKSSTPVDDTTTEATTEATTDKATEATTDKATEATTAEATETTTRKPSSGGGGGGGGSSHKTTTTEATTEATTKSSVVEGDVEATTVEVSIKVPTDKITDFEGFIDIDNYPWAEDSINKLAELGIISGIGDRLYGPALPCRRCDFAILINRTLGVSVSATPKNFYDNEDQSKYYYNDCLVGYNAGILSGYGNNYYKPEQYCTREEMAVLIAKSFEWLGNDVTSTDLSVNNKYSDVDNISWWSAPYVAYLTDKGILNGNTDGTLLPQNYINRAEMAVMMAKVYDYALELVNGGADLDLNEVEG